MDKKMNILLIITILEAIIIGALTVMAFQSEDYEKARFIGEWKSNDGYVTYEFYPDGTCLVDNSETGTWEINNGKMVITTNDGHNTQINEYSFSFTLGGLTFINQYLF